MKNSHHTHSKTINIENNLLRLIDIKDNKDCWFQCLHSYSIFYKTPIQIINNQFIIERLMSLDASIVGVVCGEIYKEYLKQNKSLKARSNIRSNNNDSYYKLLFISRDGSIEYETTNSERHLERNVLDLVQDKELVNNFSPFDAYYLGFLAGLELYKIKNNLKLQKTKRRPDLKLIYSNPKL